MHRQKLFFLTITLTGLWALLSAPAAYAQALDPSLKNLDGPKSTLARLEEQDEEANVPTEKSPFASCYIENELEDSQKKLMIYQIRPYLLSESSFSEEHYEKLLSWVSLQFRTLQELRLFLKANLGNQLSAYQTELILHTSQVDSEHKRYELSNPSSLETRLQSSIPENKDLPPVCQVGYDYFHSDKFEFSPVNQPSVPENYKLGPGDELIVYQLSNESLPRPVSVNPNGVLTLPGVGSLPVWNLTLSELQSKLKKTSPYLHVELGKLRSIQISMVGEATHPGMHLIPVTSSIYKALALAGGVKKTGSLRKVEWQRNGELLAVVDLYDYLFKGKALKEVNLQDGDTLFIPLLDHVAMVSGEVLRPGIFELKEERTLDELIQMAGGLLATANPDRILIERIASTPYRQAVTFQQKVLSQELIHNFDIVNVLPVSPHVESFVALEGPFANTGSFEWTPGMTLYELLLAAGKPLKPMKDTSGYIKRVGHVTLSKTIPPPTFSFAYDQVMQQKAMHDFPLKSGDLVQIADRAFVIPQIVTLQGDIIENPGEYPFFEGMSLSQLIQQANGLKHKALDAKVIIQRWVEEGGRKVRTSIEASIDPQTLETSPLELLKEGDSVFLRAQANYQPPQYAKIQGEVMFPGVYEFQEGETLSDLIERAGGFTTNAFLEGAVFLRQFLKKEEEKIEQRIDKDVQRSLLRASVEAPAQIGNVNPAQSDVTMLAAAQGLRSNNDLSEQEQAFQLQQFQQGPAATPPNLTTTQQKKVSKASVVQTGRLIIHIQPLEQLRGSQDDVQLRHGDELQIPRKKESILVKGEVFGEASLQWVPDATPYYYLEVLGGPRALANLEETYVLKANGFVVRHELEHYEVQVGDTIVVPPDLTPRESALKSAASYAQIIQTILVSVALIVLLL